MAAGNVQQALKELFPQLSIGKPAKRDKKASKKALNSAVKILIFTLLPVRKAVTEPDLSNVVPTWVSRKSRHRFGKYSGHPPPEGSLRLPDPIVILEAHVGPKEQAVHGSCNPKVVCLNQNHTNFVSKRAVTQSTKNELKTPHGGGEALQEAPTLVESSCSVCHKL